jgi:hypothetical protein
MKLEKQLTILSKTGKIRKKNREYDTKWLKEMKAENVRKLDAILATPNYQEVYGKKHYGESWTCILDGNHPDRIARAKASTERSQRRLNGEDVPLRVGANRWACVQYDKEGNKIKEWKGGAMEYIDLMGWDAMKANTIVNNCKGFTNTAYGYVWKFKDKKIWTSIKRI